MKLSTLAARVGRCGVAAACVSVLVTGCTGPGGVELGTNWAGAQAFVLTKVDGLITVVGIDPVHHTSDALTVVPTRADDDDVLSPQIVELADGRWIVSTPTKGGKPSRLYRVDTEARVLDRVGTVPGERALVPVGAAVAAVGSASASTVGRSEALVYDPKSWHSGRAIPLNGDPLLTAGGGDTLCVSTDQAAGSTVTSMSLTGGKPAVATITGLAVQALACGDGAPVAARGPGTDKAPGSDPVVRLTRVQGVDVLTATAGRVDGVVADEHSITVAIALVDHVRLLTLGRADGGRIAERDLPGLGEVTGMRRIAKGWLLTSGGNAVVVSADHVDTFGVPGELLSAG